MDFTGVQSDDAAIAIKPDIPIGGHLVDAQRTAHALEADRTPGGDGREGPRSGDQVDRCGLGTNSGIGSEIQVHAVDNRPAVELGNGAVGRGQRHGAAVVGDVAAQPDVADAFDVQDASVITDQFDVDRMVGLDALGKDVFHADLGAPVNVVGFLDTEETAFPPGPVIDFLFRIRDKPVGLDRERAATHWLDGADVNVFNQRIGRLDIGVNTVPVGGATGNEAQPG